MTPETGKGEIPQPGLEQIPSAPVPTGAAEDVVAAVNTEMPVPSEKAAQVEAPQFEAKAEALARTFDKQLSRRRRTRGVFGGAILVAAAAYAAFVGTGHAADFKVTHTTSFVESAQNAVNDFDPVLADIGEGVVLAGLGAIGAAKVLSARSKQNQLATIDEWSSQEMSADGIRTRKDPVSRSLRSGLRNTVAGRVPLVLAGGVLLGSMSSAIATAVTHGPEQAIQGFTNELPGNAYLQEYPGAFTMTDSYISSSLANKVVKQAVAEHIQATRFGFDLGQLGKSGETLSDLALGVDVAPSSNLYWTPSDGCENVPVDVDSSAGVKVGDTVTENGLPARVVGVSEGTSATNRIGVTMSLEAMGFCLEKSSVAPVSGVVLNTSVENARHILEQVNTGHEVAAVVPKSEYEKNSNDFWDANVLPLISILELSSLALVGVYAQRSSKEQIVRLRREWAAKSAAGVSDNVIRATEMLRAVKDGVAASIVGGAATAVITPAAVNTLVSGIGYSVGYKNLMVGAAIGVGGAALGAAKNVVRPQKVIDVVENTRT